ncbi:MAG TPA: rhodanese-like domain-containing protein [Methanotrichaceae archaeon]|nr:rhodanese-like domain-containing protein [Methanotrichaceae archaeon]
MSLSILKQISILDACAALAVVIALAHGAFAAECSSLGGDCAASGWDPMQKLDEIGTGNYDQPQASPKWPEKSREVRWNMASDSSEDKESEVKQAPQEEATAEDSTLQRSDEFKEMLVPLEEVSTSDVLLDVSESAKEHIPGAVTISYDEFILDGGTLKSVPEITEILEKAGISHDDPLVIYGECLPCGGGPAASTYVYWIMKSLGHRNVRVMDGTLEDWKGAGRPAANETQLWPSANYTPEFTPEFIASYEYVKSGSPQVVDARTMQEFGDGSIPGSINIPYESILEGDKIKDEAALERIFAILTRERPVVVYTNTGVKASVVWFALELMGFDAKLYSYQDWRANQA